MLFVGSSFKFAYAHKNFLPNLDRFISRKGNKNMSPVDTEVKRDAGHVLK